MNTRLLIGRSGSRKQSCTWNVRQPCSPMKHRSLLALDGDGALLEAYAVAWQQAFGTRPSVRDPFGYGPA